MGRGWASCKTTGMERTDYGFCQQNDRKSYVLMSETFNKENCSGRLLFCLSLTWAPETVPRCALAGSSFWSTPMPAGVQTVV